MSETKRQGTDSLKPKKTELDLYLERLTEKVRAWPVWKQTIFGPVLPEHRNLQDKSVYKEEGINV